MRAMSTRRVLRLALALLATISCAALAQSNCCSHMGGNVACPAGLPPGSRSIQFVSDGTLWQTPDGRVVTVAQSSFPACTTSTPTPQPQQPVTPEPQKPVTPEPQK